MQTYLLYNAALGQFMTGHKTTDHAHALLWLRRCQRFMQVVRDIPTSFGEVIARGGDVCDGCGALLSAHEKTTGNGHCFGCRASDRKGGDSC